MGAADLMRELRDAGLVLALKPDGGLNVAPRNALTEERRAAIRAGRDALVLALQAEDACGIGTQQGTHPTLAPPADGSSPPPPRPSHEPLMEREYGDACHARGRDDAEIEAFATRVERFRRLGRADADVLAEGLMLRDRDQDDRRMCIECSHLGERGRCVAAATGRLQGADRRLEPVQTLLQHCPAFGLRKGLR